MEGEGNPSFYARDITLAENEMITGIVAYSARRVWYEDEVGIVRYAKHSELHNAVVDEQEFLWVKLKAETIK